jgi:hypothetical protein
VFTSVLSCTSVLDYGGVLAFNTFARLITFGSVGTGVCYCDLSSTFSSNAAKSACNCLTVVTILVVFVVCGESSSCSTHLILLRRFSILYACFYIVASNSCVLCSVGGAICTVGCYCYCLSNYSWSTLNFSSMNCSNFIFNCSSPYRSDPVDGDATSLLMAFFMPSICYYRRIIDLPCAFWCCSREVCFRWSSVSWLQVC